MLGLNFNFVDAVFTGKLPDVVVTQTGYTVALVVVSSVIATLFAFVAVPAVVALPALPSMLVPVNV